MRFVLSIFILFLFNACTIKITGEAEGIYGKGPMRDVVQYHKYFDHIQTNLSIEVYKNCNYCFETIKTDYYNLVDYIDIYVKNNTLFIQRSSSSIYNSRAKIKIYVPSGHILGITSTGTGTSIINK